MPAYHNGAGYSLLFTNEPQQAVSEFRKALDINPEFIDSLAGLGYAYLHLNRKADALDVAHRLKKLDGGLAYDLQRMIER